jgi:hypothetical protein
MKSSIQRLLLPSLKKGATTDQLLRSASFALACIANLNSFS